MITGGRVYPVRHYPKAIRLRDRKGRAILCVALTPQSGGLLGRNTRSAFRRTPSRSQFYKKIGYALIIRYPSSHLQASLNE